MQVHLDQKGLDETVKALMNLPGDFSRAKKSAMGSVGFWLMNEIRNHVEYGGSGWEGLHPLTAGFRHKRGAKGHWVRRRAFSHRTPLFWLGRFARYRVDKIGERVQIDFGKSKSGEPGRFDPQLIGIVRRAESGETIRVTEQMRRFFGATRKNRPKNPVPGEHYFPLKKETRVLDVPARPIFGPVFKKTGPHIMRRFEEKFWSALERYKSK